MTENFVSQASCTTDQTHYESTGSRSLLGELVFDGEGFCILGEEKLEFQREVYDGFDRSDYFVTLTFQPNIYISKEAGGQTLYEFLDRLNGAIRGETCIEDYERLNYFACFEYRRGGDLHVHALISRPSKLDRLKGKSFEQLIIEIWTDLYNEGHSTAVNVQVMCEVNGVIECITKKIRKQSDMYGLDGNMYLEQPLWVEAIEGDRLRYFHAISSTIRNDYVSCEPRLLHNS